MGHLHTAVKIIFPQHLCGFVLNEGFLTHDVPWPFILVKQALENFYPRNLPLCESHKSILYFPTNQYCSLSAAKEYNLLPGGVFMGGGCLQDLPSQMNGYCTSVLLENSHLALASPFPRRLACAIVCKLAFLSDLSCKCMFYRLLRRSRWTIHHKGKKKNLF